MSDLDFRRAIRAIMADPGLLRASFGPEELAQLRAAINAALVEVNPERDAWLDPRPGDAVLTGGPNRPFSHNYLAYGRVVVSVTAETVTWRRPGKRTHRDCKLGTWTRYTRDRWGETVTREGEPLTCTRSARTSETSAWRLSPDPRTCREWNEQEATKIPPCVACQDNEAAGFALNGGRSPHVGEELTEEDAIRIRAERMQEFDRRVERDRENAALYVRAKVAARGTEVCYSPYCPETPAQGERFCGPPCRLRAARVGIEDAQVEEIVAEAQEDAEAA